MRAEITKYKKAVVLGLGKSGEAAAELLLSEGTEVVVIDAADTDVLRAKSDKLREAGVDVYLGCGELPRGDYDVCVVSPGISLRSQWVWDISRSGVKVVPELELGASRCSGQVLAVTGSNGKSTMAKLCGDVMHASGLSVAVAGNYGVPVCRIAAQRKEYDWLVLEVSSFQLEAVNDFSPKVGVLLNVQPDHLDRHGNIDDYRRCKSRLFERMGNDDTAVVNLDELESVRAMTGSSANWVSFGAAAEADYRYEPGRIVAQNGNFEGEIVLDGTMFDNSIMGLTATASLAALSACGIEKSIIENAFSSFVPLPHRMERVAEVNGIRFIDDSKATNIMAMMAGIRMAGGNGVRLIAGGLLKEKNLEIAKELLANNVKSVYLIGDASSLMMKAWRDIASCNECKDLASAVDGAWRDACRGDVVLLSPGCASFDQFGSFRERGDTFKEYVRNIVLDADMNKKESK